MTARPSLDSVVVCAVAPNGHDPSALLDAVGDAHPEVGRTAVWAGDPHLRPPDPGLRWLTPYVDVEGVLATAAPPAARWAVGLHGAAALLDAGAGAVVLLTCGSVAVCGPFLDALLGSGPVHELGLVLVPGSASAAIPVPSGALAAVGVAARVMLPGLAAALADATAVRDEADVTRILLASSAWTSLRWAARRERGEAGGAESAAVSPDARWVGGLLVCPGVDPRRPWSLSPDDPAADDPSVALLVQQIAPQLGGRQRPVRRPGALPLDAPVRAAASASPDRVRPWTAPRSSRSSLTGPAWHALWAARPDLHAAFPEPNAADAARFAAWQRSAFIDDEQAFLQPPVPAPTLSAAFRPAGEVRPGGVNLVGYARHEAGLGVDVRSLALACSVADLPHGLMSFERTSSPVVADPPTTTTTIGFDTTVAVVTAVEMPALRRDHPELFRTTRRMVGYWMWEIEDVPPAMRAALHLVDEVWTGSEFCANAFRAVTERPVRVVRTPVAEPATSGRSRDEFPVLAPFAGRPLLLVVFDHFSVTERKNPVGAIEAFRRAFAPGEGPVLVVKSMNAAKRWPDHQRVLHAAHGRDDIVVWDEHLSRPDAMSLVAEADVLVSLHRGEGRGLHLAEAMWLGTPTIATRYSGNLDFMDDESSMLVDATMIPVRNGRGAYPDTARWADPDLDQAAAAMRALVASPELAANVIVAARRRMEAEPDLASTGRLLRHLLLEG